MTNNDFGDLININDKWARGDAIREIIPNPSKENLNKIEAAINQLTGKQFTPYKNDVGDMDQNAAIQGLIYYSQIGNYQSDPYAASALIEIAGSRIDFADRQLRASGDNLSAAILDLLTVHLKMSKMI